MTDSFDVAVVGFGPSGAVAACLLGHAGLRTLVIDSAREVWPKPRAIAIDHEIMRVLQNLGVVEQVLPHVAPFPASEHFGVDGQLIRRVDMVPPPYPLGYVPSMVFSQPPVEAALRAHAAAYGCVEIGLGVALRTFTQDHSGVTLGLDDGTTRRASYVIGCDGASSTVRTQLGIAYEDLVFDEPWMVIDLMVHEHALSKLPATAAQYCEPARPATYIVGPGRHRRWEIMLLPGEDPREMEQSAQVWALLSRWLSPEDATLWRATSYRFHALVAADWRRGRVFIAGDAAHQQPPFIGQGMCQGIRDVVNLAWKLRAVMAGDADEALLDTYAEERGQHVRTLTARIKTIGHAICERDPARARARDTKLLADNGGVPPQVTRQDIVPPLERGLLARTPHPANGTLFPQPRVRGPDGPLLLDQVTGSGWRLVLDARRVRSGAAVADVRVVLIGQPDDAPKEAPEGCEIELDGVIGRWFDRHCCVGALVRPDHYCFGVLHGAAEAQDLLQQMRARLRVTERTFG